MIEETKSVHPRLVGFPQSVQDRYVSYQQSPNPGDLSAFVLGALGFLSEDDEGVEALGEAPDEVKLEDRLVIDSLAVAELMFLLEDLFSFKIDDERMREMVTFGDLRAIAAELNQQSVSTDK